VPASQRTSATKPANGTSSTTSGRVPRSASSVTDSAVSMLPVPESGANRTFIAIGSAPG
jgi:hypothetical protein